MMFLGVLICGSMSREDNFLKVSRDLQERKIMKEFAETDDEQFNALK